MAAWLPRHRPRATHCDDGWCGSEPRSRQHARGAPRAGIGWPLPVRASASATRDAQFRARGRAEARARPSPKGHLGFFCGALSERDLVVLGLVRRLRGHSARRTPLASFTFRKSLCRREAETWDRGEVRWPSRVCYFSLWQPAELASPAASVMRPAVVAGLLAALGSSCELFYCPDCLTETAFSLLHAVAAPILLLLVGASIVATANAAASTAVLTVGPYEVRKPRGNGGRHSSSF